MGIDLAGLNIDIGAIDSINLDSLLGAPDVLGDSPALADTEGLLSALDGNLNLPEAENLTTPDVTPVAAPQPVAPVIADAGGVPELGDLLGDALVSDDTTAATPAAVPEIPQDTETPAEKSKRTRRKAAAVDTPAEQVKAENIEAASNTPHPVQHHTLQHVYGAGTVPSTSMEHWLPLSFHCQVRTPVEYGKLMKYAGQLILGEA